jgi:type II secretory ATPase GspE/PulE/Tfp pilus assembly ATPase PilB-like protein
MHRAISRIKVIGGLDVSDKLRPQDGRCSVRVDDKVYDLRISTVPTRGTEKAVLRILDPSAAPSLDGVGVQAVELEAIMGLLSHREGIVVVMGPTGSGKTTTLYAALRHLATEDVNVMTVENPIEYDLPGLTQIQVNRKQGVTFAGALRAVLRQDPDIILVGEIRDLETAEIAVQASLTGHLVLTTLHTNDAIASIQQLQDLGLDRPSIAEGLVGIVAQRLVRRLCTECSTPNSDTGTESSECTLCDGSGSGAASP